ncbi:MAG: glycosyltransferase family 39 protein [Nanoarchaeota archaeon]
MSKLFIIFLLALFLRFLYFPDNIYFGFDQARDAYASLNILKGDLKIIGPPTSVEGLNHGVLYYYIITPFYFLGNLNPEFVSAVLRILNALGVFLIFYIGSILFDKRIGFLASLLYAVSFEQTQFSIYMGNPSLAVLSVLCMYTGLAMVIYRNLKVGFPLATLGLGFSIQFQFALLYLLLPFILILIIFKKNFLMLHLKAWLVSILVFLLSVSTFIFAEIKYNFRTFHSLTLFGESEKNFNNISSTYIFILSRMGKYNIVGEILFGGIILFFLLLLFIFLLKKKEYSSRMVFLGIWFFSILTTVLINGGVSNLANNIPLYYPNVGVSLALLIFIAFLLRKLLKISKITGVFAVLLIVIANFKLIQTFNPKGTISEINVQQGMLLSEEKKVLDYMYNESGSGIFAVKGVTMPFYINTTWSYLFEWYGLHKYGYFPVWNGKNAEGFYGNLAVQEAQEGLPEKRFLVIEPVRGIAPHLIEEYIDEENYFTKIVEEKKFGEFIVQKREKF